MNTKEKKKTKILAELSNFRGTTKYHKHSPFLFPTFHLTDGTSFLADECDAHWLFDFIADNQKSKLIVEHRKLQQIQFWTLEVKDSQAVIKCESDTDEIVFKKRIEYTDFPLDKICIWVSPLYLSLDDEGPKKWVAYLSSEH